MTEKVIIKAALCLIYYHIGGLATTNMLRLTKGNTLPVRSSVCVCDNCGKKIHPLLQLPIISYIICKGKCKNCGVKIPVFPLLLEISVFVGMSAVSLLFGVTYTGILMSFLYYEAVRIFVVAYFGKREADFLRQYAVAVVSMLVFLFLCEAVAVIYSVV